MPERERAPESVSLGQRPRQQAERPRRETLDQEFDRGPETCRLTLSSVFALYRHRDCPICLVVCRCRAAATCACDRRRVGKSSAYASGLNIFVK